MPHPLVTVVIPTLNGGESLARCVACLQEQNFKDFEIVIVDNSGSAVAAALRGNAAVRVIENNENVGFGAAVNQAAEKSQAVYIATLNDDAYPHPDWLAALAAACRDDPSVGMCASRIRLANDPRRLDSAGLAIYPDGTTKQRGHRAPVGDYEHREDVLLPSGCAALFRRAMLGQVGGFDADYFLYGEESDLGLRARHAGWRCVYAPGAVVDHDYSKSAGRASRLKAYYVERNRLFTVIKDFPVLLWPLVPYYSLWRYAHHAAAALTGRGLASEFEQGGESAWRLAGIVVSAHWGAFKALPQLLRKRRAIRRRTTLGALAFCKLMRRYSISAAEITSQ
ncbi:MAG: glycosyltransferase family 2 protein [Acidobacteria bacterium]|nr:glycosyltransferase family 2 protein [Acidobacteriota bacterium]